MPSSGAENGLVVVAGATGYLGRAVARTLAQAGWRVRALARDPAGLGDVADLCHEVFVGHATRPDTLAGLCDGAAAVFSSIGIRHFRRQPTIWDVDWRANENIVRLAERAGVRDFVFVSLRPFNTNLAAFSRMFSLLGEEDAVAPCRGSMHLGDFYRSLADAKMEPA